LNLSDYAWYTSYEITKKKLGEVKVLLRRVPYPYLGRDEYGYIIFLPKMSVLSENAIEYQGEAFNIDNEYHRQIAWDLFKASNYYLSLFIAASSAKEYADFAEGRNEDRVLNAINLVEDASINAYIKVFHQQLLPDFLFADTVSHLLLKSSDAIRDEGLRFSSSILSYYKTGLIKGSIPEEMRANVVHVAGILKELEDGMIELYRENKKRLDSGESPTANFAIKVKTLYRVYDELQRYESETSEIPSFPYMNHLSRSSIFYKINSLNLGEIKNTFDNIARHLNLEIDFDTDYSTSESTQFLSDWLLSEKSRDKILTRYKAIGDGMHFKSFTFPEEDYAEYVRRRDENSRSVRRIINRLGVIYNLSGEDFRRDTGGLDLQEAIQVVASRSDRTDVFIDETLQYRSQAWAVLVDVSHSLRAFSGEVKDVALCLTEAARRLFRDNHSLGVFAFDDKFYIIKDFSETCSNQVCARIGGIEHGGMTYLSDGVKMVSEVLRRRTEETRIMVVVSDGFPAGYTHVGEESKNQIKSISRSGIHVIGIGISSRAVKDYFPVSCVVKTPYDLMKSFVNIYLQYTSMM